jgi:hypothetical protein
MFDALDGGRAPIETFYDGYVVNTILDAAYRSAKSRQWEPVQVEWRATEPAKPVRGVAREVDGYALVKEERMHGNKLKQILSDKQTGRIVERIVDIES